MVLHTKKESVQAGIAYTLLRYLRYNFLGLLYTFWTYEGGVLLTFQTLKKRNCFLYSRKRSAILT
jgi:hypothetical protein